MALVDCFLKVDGIEGESADATHKGEIQVEAWSWGATQMGAGAVTAAGLGTGKVRMDDFRAEIISSKASPKLMLACANGEHIKKAVLTCRKAGKDAQEFLKLTMSDLLVSGFRTEAGTMSRPLPKDQISLNFVRIEWEYKEQKADGTLGGPIRGGWDLKANKAI